MTFGDLDGRLEHLEIACARCGRLGRYSLKRLILARGRNGKLPDWIDEMTRECPQRVSPGLAQAMSTRPSRSAGVTA